MSGIPAASPNPSHSLSIWYVPLPRLLDPYTNPSIAGIVRPNQPVNLNIPKLPSVATSTFYIPDISGKKSFQMKLHFSLQESVNSYFYKLTKVYVLNPSFQSQVNTAASRASKTYYQDGPFLVVSDPALQRQLQISVRYQINHYGLETDNYIIAVHVLDPMTILLTEPLKKELTEILPESYAYDELSKEDKTELKKLETQLCDDCGILQTLKSLVQDRRLNVVLAKSARVKPTLM